MVMHGTVFSPWALLLAILLLLLTSPVHVQARPADSQLDVQLNSSDIQWGQFFRLTLRYQGSQKLTNIDLRSWQKLMAINFDDDYIDEDEDGNPVQVLKLRLHPRHTGRLQLPSLKIGSAHSQAVDIDVGQPVIKDSAIELHWQISTSSPWQREAVLIQVRLHTSDYAARIRLDAPEQKQFIARTLKPERHVLADGSYRFDAGWILYPIDNGRLTLDLPPVRYQIAGSDRRQFYLPLQTLQVKALPNYLPPTLPVGRLDIDSKIIDSKDGDPLWQLRIKTDALIPYGAPALDTQLATISAHDIADIEIKYTQRSDYSEHGDRSLYLSPMPDWLMPFGKDLRLTLRYFDTGSGRLREVTHSLPRYWNMPVWAWWVTVISGLILCAFILRHLRPWIRIQIRRLKLRHRLRDAETIDQMRRMILDSGPYVTLSDWSRSHPGRKNASHELNAYRFSAEDIGDSEKEHIRQDDIQQLKIDLLTIV